MTNTYDEADWEELQFEKEIKEQLSPFVTKNPSNEDTHSLINALQPEMDKIIDDVQETQIANASIWNQVRNQLKQLSLSFWVGSIALFIMISFISNNFGFRNDLSTNLYQPIVILLPVYLILAIFYTFRSWNKEMRAIETATPFPPALLLLIRMVLVFLVFVIFSLISTLFILGGFNFKTNSFLLILNWLSPSILVFSVIAFCMYCKGIVTGLLFAFGSWLAYLCLPVILKHLGYINDFSLFHVIQGIICTFSLILLFIVINNSRTRFDLFIQ